jgi:hypothetical protein
LDLSYRAQLKTGIQISWKCGYPCWITSHYKCYEIQQIIKEELKTSVKCRSYTQSKSIDWKQKRMACFILLNSTMFLAIFTMAVYVNTLKMSLPYSKSIWLANLLSSLPSSFFISYWATFSIHGGGFKNFLTYITLFITFYTIAMDFHFIIP